MNPEAPVTKHFIVFRQTPESASKPVDSAYQNPCARRTIGFPASRGKWFFAPAGSRGVPDGPPTRPRTTLHKPGMFEVRLRARQRWQKAAELKIDAPGGRQ